MRRLRAVCGALFILCLANSPATMAQGSQGCTPRDGGDYPYSTCLRVSNTLPQVGDTVTVEAWVESRASAWLKINTSIAILDGSTLIASGNTNPSTKTFLAPIIFVSAGQIALRADPATGPDSFTQALNVSPRQPVFAHTVSPTTSRLGQTVHVTADVTLYGPNGIVIFYLRSPSGTLYQSARVPVNQPNNGLVTIHLERDVTFNDPIDNPPGEYGFSVGYEGDARNASGRSNEIKVKVGPFPTSTSLSQSPIGSKQGMPFTLTATVAANLSGTPVPTGTVEFYDGTTLLGSATLNAQRTATFTGRLGKLGAHSLTARYLGDTNNQASTSTPVSHEITFNPALMVPIFELLLE